MIEKTLNYAAPLEARPQVLRTGKLCDGVPILDHSSCISGIGISDSALSPALAIQNLSGLPPFVHNHYTLSRTEIHQYILNSMPLRVICNADGLQ